MGSGLGHGQAIDAELRTSWCLYIRSLCNGLCTGVQHWGHAGLYLAMGGSSLRSRSLYETLGVASKPLHCAVAPRSTSHYVQFGIELMMGKNVQACHSLSELSMYYFSRGTHPTAI